jgi:hypothetical protein
VAGKLFGHPRGNFFSEFDYVGRVGRYIEIHIYFSFQTIEKAPSTSLRLFDSLQRTEAYASARQPSRASYLGLFERSAQIILEKHSYYSVVT